MLALFLHSVVFQSWARTSLRSTVASRQRQQARQRPLIGRFSNRGRLGSTCTKGIQPTASVDVAHGLVLLFGIGTKALPSWDSRTRRNNLTDGLAVSRRQVQATERTHLIHRPARDIIPPLVELEFPPIGSGLVGLSCDCRSLFPGPAELGAVDPDAVHDHGQSTGERHDRLSSSRGAWRSASPQALEPRPVLPGAAHHAQRRLCMRMTRSSPPSPQRDILPLQSTSPDWYLAHVSPNAAPTALDLRKRAGMSTVAR